MAVVGQTDRQRQRTIDLLSDMIQAGGQTSDLHAPDAQREHAGWKTRIHRSLFVSLSLLSVCMYVHSGMNEHAARQAGKQANIKAAAESDVPTGWLCLLCILNSLSFSPIHLFIHSFIDLAFIKTQY